jgi:transposase InsO family protein
MSKPLDLQSIDIDQLKAALEALSAKNSTKIQAETIAKKGRRYGHAEKKIILEDLENGKSASDLFEKHGVARETLSKWKRRKDMSSGRATADPKPPENQETNPAPAEPTDQHSGYHAHWKEVLAVWRSRPGLGPAQIKNQLYRDKIKISVATVRKILEENGYTPPKTTVKEIEARRYEAARPLELVHMDFKHFYINKQKVYLLLLQDDFSRFLCGHRMTDSENMKSVIEAFEECVNRYGKMQTVMTDAGSAFYSWNGINKFQKLMSDEYGVDQLKASTPRSNGKVENVNKQIEKEVLDVKRYASLMEADAAVEEWVEFYNFERTHMGLPDGMVPADRFLYGWDHPKKNVPKKIGVNGINEETQAAHQLQARPFEVPKQNKNLWESVLQLAIENLKLVI